ncbi:SpoIIE family protein phosphatase [Streptomyces sp. SL13]|uniref:SpoIIE family protein phosphatase n=1 Tax=Streptantibioticus silvisoli TaxID=2705255 RepID=A0AA90KIH6_9ACTN|nr:SpoIIE family protein phosphatase [Streptantibioticus silvisoli]MDI5972629.1 SpoIIE family protein phosphatase [Streptantibioticus silvisoli]
MGSVPRANGDEPFLAGVGDTLHAIEAVGVALLLRAPDAPQLDAAAVVVTPLGSGVVENVRLDDEVFATANAYRSGRVVGALPMDIMSGHPELSAFAPFPYAVGSAPVFAGGRRPAGTLTAFWQRPYGGPQPWELAGLASGARRLTRELTRRARAGTPPVPPPVPVVVAADTEVSGNVTSTAPHLYHLHKLAVLLSSAADTRKAVQMTVQRLTGGFGALGAVVTSLSGRQLRVLGQQGCSGRFAAELDGAALSDGSPEADAVATRRQCVLSPADPRAAGRLADASGPGERVSGDRTAEGAFWVVVPLLSGQRVIGTCSMAFDAGRDNLVAEQSVLTALATLLGQALERTRLLDGQHALAARLQRILLPGTLAGHPRLTSASRYLSATSGIEIGGDWYEMIRLPGGGVALVVGDVEGHNVPAAVVMGQLRGAMRAYAAEGHGPGTLLARSDRLLVGLDTDLFATCCCVALDPEHGTAEIATAGHPPPLLRTPDGGYPALGVVPGPPLGVAATGADFPVRRLDLAPGSLLALYTDGLASAVDGELPPRALEEGVADGLGLGELCDLLTDPDAAGAPPHHHDDAALLLVRYEGRYEGRAA